MKRIFGTLLTITAGLIMIVTGIVSYDAFTKYLKADCINMVIDEFEKYGKREFIETVFGRPEDYLVTMVATFIITIVLLVAVVSQVLYYTGWYNRTNEETA